MHSRVEAALAKHQHIRLTSVSPEIWAGWFHKFLANAGLVRPNEELDEDVKQSYFFQFCFQAGVPLREAAEAWQYYRAGTTNCGQVDSVERVSG